MEHWLEHLKTHPRPLPLLSFPGLQLLGDVTVRQAVCDSRLQAACMKAVADRVDAAAAVSFSSRSTR